MFKVVLLLSLTAFVSAVLEENNVVQGVDICEGESCGTQCNGNNCSYCSGGNCCETRECNGCVNVCRSGCGSNSCVNDCFNSCSYRQRRCRPRTCNPLQVKYVESSSRGSTNPIDITTTLNMTNEIHNVNHINIPINSTVMNIVHTNIADTRNSSNCCTVLPPQQCHYENKTLHCTQEPKRICSSQCNKPLIIERPVPYPIRIPVPHPVRVPIHVPVPHPVQIPIRIPVPHPVQVPVYIPSPPRESPCAPVLYNQRYYPSCQNIQDSTHLWQNGNRFIIQPDTSLQPPNCSSCLSCGSANLDTCIKSGMCPSQCAPYLQNVWPHIQSGTFMQ
ncbi:PREDICTED: uncharacterized protein LOC108567814 [Nicrophorus vespilloides]|uniref:Uncharacterized protein LOC108567814 n=1 Tax=Nicrophorus vespilloides TaxID=110193 RepID=A0ABM1NAZ6_NICVS|nr:PREDICTED: uncharacterized protein LOC108567814 [Nicrophorus vespilloides]